MKRDKITLMRAIKCHTPCRISPKEGDRYLKAIAFEDFYGFRFEDCWNLDTETAYWLLIRLIYFRDNLVGLPYSYLTGKKYYMDHNYNTWTDLCEGDGDFKRWKTCLDKIIRGLFLYITRDSPTDKEKKVINKGFKLLMENWQNLWN